MKKVLVSLLVLALAMTSVFAAVNFGGEFVGGYNFNYNNDEWTSHIMGQDGTGSHTTKLNLSFADENGLWKVTTEGEMVADKRLAGDISIDMMKLFNAESDVSVKFGLAMNDEQTVLRAYSNQSGKNFDRIRTAANGLWANVNVAYGNLVQVQVAGAPEFTSAADDEAGIDGEGGDLVVSALTNPLDGLKVSAGWVLKGDGQNGSLKDGAFTAAADVNVATLAGLNFDLGVSASYIIGFADAAAQTIAATVYGGVDLVDAYVEYSASITDAATKHFLVAGANLNVVENMILDVFFGATDLENFGDTVFVGGDIGYTLQNVTFKLGVEYAKGSAFSYDLPGLSIVPQVSVAF